MSAFLSWIADASGVDRTAFDRSLNPTFARRGPVGNNRIAVAGNSLEGAGFDGTGAYNRAIRQSRRYESLGNFGVGGTRSDQYASQIISALATGARRIGLGDITNDVAQNVAQATYRQNQLNNIEAIIRGGAAPILHSQFPNDASAANARAHADHNVYLSMLGRKLGLPVVDRWTPLANPDGTYKSGTKYDNIHPSNLADDIIVPKFIAAWDNPNNILPLRALIDKTSSFGLFRSAVSFGGVQSGALPTGYSTIGSAGSPVYSVVAPDAGDFGNWLRTTFGGSTSGAYVGWSGSPATFTSLGWEIGDRIAIGVRVRWVTTGPNAMLIRLGMGGSFGFSTGSPLYDEKSGASGRDDLIYWEGNITSGTTANFTLSAATTGAGYFEAQSPEVINLTKNGLVL